MSIPTLPASIASHSNSTFTSSSAENSIRAPLSVTAIARGPSTKTGGSVSGAPSVLKRPSTDSDMLPVASEILILNEKSESTQNDIKLEKKIKYFNAIKSIIIESHSDENYPRGG